MKRLGTNLALVLLHRPEAKVGLARTAIEHAVCHLDQPDGKAVTRAPRRIQSGEVDNNKAAVPRGLHNPFKHSFKVAVDCVVGCTLPVGVYAAEERSRCRVWYRVKDDNGLGNFPPQRKGVGTLPWAGGTTTECSIEAVLIHHAPAPQVSPEASCPRMISTQRGRTQTL